MDNDLTHFEPNGNSDFMNKFKFFQVPKQNKTIEDVFESVYYPQIPITDNTKEIEIKIDAQEFFIDLSNTFVTFDITILNEDGTKLLPISPGTEIITTTTSSIQTQTSTIANPTNLPLSPSENQRKRKRNDSDDSENDDEIQYKKKKKIGITPNPTKFLGVGLEQAIGSSIFRDIDIKLNNQSICGLKNTYYWIGYLQNVLCYNEDARKSRLETNGFYEDSDPSTTDFFQHSGSRTRALLTDQSKKWSIKTGIYHGLFQISKVLIPMISLNFNFMLNDKLKVLKTAIQNTEFKYSISNFKLFIKKIKVSNDFQSNIERQLSKTHASYCFDHLRCTEISLAAGTQNQHFPDIFNNVIQPELCVIWFVNHAASQGSYPTSIFNAQHFDLKEIYLRLENVTYPAVPYELNFTDADFSNKFVRLWSNLLPGDLSEDNGILIDQKKFKDGFTFFLINFSPDLNGLFVPKIGTTFLHLNFKTALVNPVKMFIFTKNPVCLRIDSDRQVNRDYVL